MTKSHNRYHRKGSQSGHESTQIKRANPSKKEHFESWIICLLRDTDKYSNLVKPEAVSVQIACLWTLSEMLLKNFTGFVLGNFLRFS